MVLSVIIVSYNEKEYLSQAIESCLNQTFQDFEIIIGDDGSTDGSYELIQKYESTYLGKIKCFQMNRCGGGIIPSIRVSNIVKHGLSMARGDYFILLSGDDYFSDRNSFEKQVTCLQKTQNQSISGCVTGFRKFWNDGEEQIFEAIKYPASLYWSGAYVHISCVMFRREVFDKGLLLENFCDDTGLEFSTLLNGKWTYVQNIAFSYRQRDKSIMSSADEMELSLLELLLYQDCMARKGMFFSTMSRFARPLKTVFRNRTRINEKRYNEYVQLASNHPDSIVMQISSYDSFSKAKKLKLQAILLFSQLLTFFFRIVRKVYRMI